MLDKYLKKNNESKNLNEEDISSILGFSLFFVIMTYLEIRDLDVALMAGVVSFFLLRYLMKNGL